MVVFSLEAVSSVDPKYISLLRGKLYLRVGGEIA
jgi:hypothetical protein